MNDQITQALAQLRDIHEPAIPPYWPIPIGWWILTVSVIATVVFLLWCWRRRYTNDRPYRSIRNAASDLRDLYQNGRLSNREYVDSANRLYKHLLVDVEAVPGSVQADGLPWLNMLADRFNEEAFVSGAGKCLGTVRYRPVSFFDERIDELIAKTLCDVRYPARSGIAT